MDVRKELVQYAKALPRGKRQSLLMAFPETKLHKHVKSLFDSMEPAYRTVITYGTNEHAKDLVIVKKDNIGIDVTAVVVRCGSINETSVAAVDQLIREVTDIVRAGSIRKFHDVESQVKEAQEHPAEEQTIFRDLPAGKVIVVVAGGFHHEARKRLVTEVPINQGDVLDIDWLIAKCTEYYPQIFFEQEVIEYLYERIAQLEVKHWLGGKGQNLSDYYVEILVKKVDERDQSKARERSADRPSTLANLKDLVEQDRRVILVGDPTSGKSISLVRLAIQMFRDAAIDVIRGADKKQLIELPILVHAKQVLELDDTESLLGTQALSPELKSRMVVSALLVDALDEVSFSQRQQALEKASQFADELKINLVVASRKMDLVKTAPEGFAKYELLPFEFNQALKFLDKLAGGDKDKLKVLKSGLEKIQFKMPMVPLSLILLLELVDQKREVPASVNELYDSFSEIAHGRWEKDKGIEMLFEVSSEEALLGRLGTYRIAYKRKG
jgi:hypothetical protein